MQPSEKHKVSLRGASAKEITRDALLEKAAQERAVRSEARKIASAAQLIQRVWRGRYAACKAADKLRADWDVYVSKEWSLHQKGASMQFLSSFIVRPFLLFIGLHRFCLHKITRNNGDHGRFVMAFTILLQSVSSSDACENFCSLSTGSKEQQTTWLYQVRKLIRLCCVGIVEGSTWHSSEASLLASLAVRLLVAFTDASLWRTFDEAGNKAHARLIVQSLLEWIAHGNADLYPALRIYILHSCPCAYQDTGQSVQLQKDNFFVTASVITVALRPLRALSAQDDDGDIMMDNDVCFNERQRAAARKATEDFCTYILTIPFITQRLPAAILPALQHPSVFTHCLEVLMASTIDLHGADTHSLYSKSSGKLSFVIYHYGHIPPSAWALANIVTLAAGPPKKCNEDSELPGEFVKGLDCEAYVVAACSILEQLLPWIEGLQLKVRVDKEEDVDESALHTMGLTAAQGPNDAVLRHLTGQFQPLCEQWHLKQLLDHIPRKGTTSYTEKVAMHSASGSQNSIFIGLRLPHIAKLYANLLTLISALKGPWPVLNVLAFAPGFLFELWEWLDDALQITQSGNGKKLANMDMTIDSSVHSNKAGIQRKDDRPGGSLSTRWASAVSKIKGKVPSADATEVDKVVFERKSHGQDLVSDTWEIKSLKGGPGGIPHESLPVLLLFCAAYGHLLMVLDDDEFYEQQVPFTLEQQCFIAASLNTLVYHGFFCSSKHQFTSLMEAATKCLHSLYGRDCRHTFCPPSLWLAPAVANRPPVAAAARAHEAAIASLKVGEFAQAPAIGNALTVIPHVFPFEERVQIFREFVKSDKMSRKMAGEVVGPGPGSIEIAIRRDHLVEDGFTQLNPLGAKLKSGINVSFVNEHGLPEAGLDYGGLFKEFLTDLAKAAFDPGYGLFTQTTIEGLLFPHQAAANIGHGLQMIEFLGRIVGKALYEGILLDYSFAHVFVWKLLGRYSFLDELSTLDPELHHNLMYLKRYEGDARDLALDFTVTEEIFGRRTVVDLISGGANIQVTNENKLQYVHAMADYKLNRQMRPLINAFSRGLSDLISPTWLSLFNAREFNQLLSGGEHDLDVDDLKVNTRYTGGFTENSRVIKNFWEVVKEFQPQERCALLKFVTSCSRGPLLGFKHLQPAFTIHKVSCDTPLWAVLGGQDIERLPSASTCYNTLKLPNYKRISTLRNKLRYAIQCNAGFELS